MKKKYMSPRMQEVWIGGNAMLCTSGLVSGEGGSVDPDDNPYEGEFMSLDDDWKTW